MTTKLIRTIAALALASGAAFAAAPAQSASAATQAFGCDQRDLNDGWYNYCWGEPRPRQYQTQVQCARGDAPLRKYDAKGPWRYYGTGNPSIARCNSGDFLTGNRQLNFQ